MSDTGIPGDRAEDVEGDVDPGERAFTQATAAASGGGSVPADAPSDEAAALAEQRNGRDDADTD